ncbi:putative bifunctional diguanylate cyclase/phosphodiesterase [Exiguobacterium aestuarii]|uniref:Bifunctional diguanylate cyclase/phosphodiesterase n=1 Tax=Exiguobacterium aestuarii TaxID=273527 RepID=A0ABW2PIB6_9BACL|nr:MULTISPECIES: bifunctional diguanylate cyclase/phosphodiesterase [Exiguobacterium]MCT4785093.1 bifunctional diguanylate cyclase/phosphodiesterase [Exiguobacterium aestuarii]
MKMTKQPIFLWSILTGGVLLSLILANVIELLEGLRYLSVTFIMLLGLRISVESLMIWRKNKSDIPFFWLLFGIAFTCFWMYRSLYELYIQSDTFMPYMVVLVVEIMSFISLFIALLYKLSKRRLHGKGKSYVFDLLIYLTILTAMMIQGSMFLNQSVHYDFMAHQYLNSTVQVLYTGVLITILTIFYFNKIEMNNRNTTQVLVGLTLIVCIDFVKYPIYHTSQPVLVMLDYLTWLLSFLLISNAVHNQLTGRNTTRIKPKRREKMIFWSVRELLLPTFAIFVLLILTLASSGWDVDLFGLAGLICIPLFMAKQFVVSRDNTRLVENLEQIAYRDKVTTLGNRDAFLHMLHQELVSYEDSKKAIVILNVNRLKKINDTYGHRFGNEVIRECVHKIKENIDPDHELFVLGGGEFAFLYTMTTSEEMESNLHQVSQAFATHVHINQRDVLVSIRIGVYEINHSEDTVTSILEKADIALKKAKEYPTHSVVIFNEYLQSSLIRKMKIEKELRHALANDEFDVHYQPKFCLKDDSLVGVEALVRWENEHLGKVGPGEFIPIAEQMGLIYEIGECVFRQAVGQCLNWNQWLDEPISVSVNVSVLQLEDRRFVGMIEDAIQQIGIPPELVELEITESVAQNLDENRITLSQLKQIGVKCSIDDFGTGYSSLNVLEQLPIDTLKIDKSFIDRLNHRISQSVIETIIHLCTVLNLEIVAEGIESKNQADVLREIGCNIGQGYYFSKPLNQRDMSQLLRNYSKENKKRVARPS